MSLKAALAGVFGPGKAPAPEGPAPNEGARRPTARKGVPPAAAAAVYRPARSFIDHLPWAEGLDDGTILLEDGRSAGAAWEIEPRGTEGRSGAWLTELRDALHDALQDSLEERDAAPWVVQTYTWREPDLTTAAEAFAEYVAERARGSVFSDAYADLLAAHYRGVAKPGGLFTDRLSQTRWAGARQRTVVVVHRWVREARVGGDDAPPGAAVLEAGGKLMAALEASAFATTVSRARSSTRGSPGGSTPGRSSPPTIRPPSRARSSTTKPSPTATASPRACSTPTRARTRPAGAGSSTAPRCGCSPWRAFAGRPQSGTSPARPATATR